jgi:hypothetical protein
VVFAVRVRFPGYDVYHEVEAASAEHAIRQLVDDLGAPGPWRFEFLLSVPEDWTRRRRMTSRTLSG